MIMHKEKNWRIDGNRQFFNGLVDETEMFVRVKKDNDPQDHETLENEMLRTNPENWETVDC